MVCSVAPALALDLPINIDAIGQMGAEGGRDAITARHGADLFSPTAEEVDAALAYQFALRRATAAYGLFGEVRAGELDIEQQLLRAADESALFGAPMQFGRTGPAMEETGGISTWLVVLIILACATGGFVLAQVLRERRGRRADVSHIDD